MSILNVENLGFGFGDKTLLKNVSFRLLREDHAGLVGINGSGKTTFFNILTGKLIPDEGSVTRPESVKIGYLDQHAELEDGLSIRDTLKQAFDSLYQIDKRILEIGESFSHCTKSDGERLLKELGRLQDKLYASDFYMIESLVDNVAGGLGLLALGMNTPVNELSGGQRTKVKLARLLLGKPDLLLLDEPTNYLDKEHVDWLTDYLVNYPNCYMVISHDTEFLNKITNVIYHIEFTQLKRYPGNYNYFLRTADEEKRRYIEQYNRQQKEIKFLEDFIKRNIAQTSTTKMAKDRRKKLERIERLEKPKTLPKPHYSFLESRESTRHVFSCTELDIGYTYPIIKGLELEIVKGQKIAITGCNGIGKSTLLKTIMGVIEPLGGLVDFGEYLYPMYFEQEVKVKDITPMEEVWSLFPKKSQKEIRDGLAKCGLRQEHVTKSMTQLSGGEQAKVRLCKLMMTPANWLLLDEPTNHLDVNAKEALREALIRFKGTVLLVCHEKEFYEGWVTDVWDMEEYVMNKGFSRRLAVK